MSEISIENVNFILLDNSVALSIKPIFKTVENVVKHGTHLLYTENFST